MERQRFGMGRKELRRPSSGSQNISPPKEERSTITTPSNLFSRSNSYSSVGSAGSLATELSRTNLTDDSKKDDGNQKIILQTAPRRSSVVGNDDLPPAQLVYNTSYGGKMEFDLVREETTLGRREDNHICLTDGKISKYHAVCIKNDRGYFIKDRNSSNGVRLNDNLIEPGKPERLNDGDAIMIGSISLVFNDPSSAKRMKMKKHMTLEEKYLKLVTILPSEKKYEETVTIRAELEAEQDVDFSKIDNVEDIQTLKEDYEKLRMAYELSKMSVSGDINKLLARSLDLMFDILPVDRGVVLLVDQATGFLSTHYVKLGEKQAKEVKEILLSSTIIQKVFYSRKCLVTSDAYEDPMLGKAASVRYGQIRSVICVPLIAHNKVYGILHLDSKDRINSFSSKDLSLVKAISNQTAMVIENMNLIKEVENKARITEQLSRFLPPHVVDRMTKKAEIIKTSVREQVATVVFADIRGFTEFSEKNSPHEVVTLLNDYFERLVKIVFRYDGIVDKFIGDALMASFGTIEDEPESEFRATAAALEFQIAIRNMNEERARLGHQPIAVGVGINTGEMVAGFIGSSQRLEFTCIGDNVNVSSRICSLASGSEVLISESTYTKIRGRVYCEPIGLKQLKGKVNEVMIYKAIKIKN